MSHALFALGVEVDTVDAALDLVEADVVEALEAGAVDGAHAVIGHEEVLLPAHEEVFLLGPGARQGIWARSVLGQGLVGREAGPMLAVDLFGGPPLGMLGDEGVVAADDFALKVRRQARVVFGQAYGRISTRALGYCCLAHTPLMRR